MPLTPEELFAKVKAIESQLCVKQEGLSTLVTLESLRGDVRMYVRMPNEVWLHFLKRQIESLPADTPIHGCIGNPFPEDPEYAGDAEHLPVLPPPDASREDIPNKSCPAQQSPLPGDEGTGDKT